MHHALTAALSRALLALANREFDATTLASGQRLALDRRRQDLARSLAPCRRTRTAAILATMGSMASSRPEADPDTAGALVAQDLEDLQGFPEWALAAAVQAFRTGVIGSGKWRPTAGELAKEARRLVGPFAQEHAEISRVLDSPQLTTPPRVRISPEKFAALKAQLAQLGAWPDMAPH